MDQRAFEQQVMPHKHRMYRLAMGMLSDGPSAEDTVQDVLLKTWKRRGELGSIERLDAWLLRVTRNACLDHLRSPKSKTVGLEEASVMPSTAPDPARQAETRDAMRMLHRLMRALPDSQRSVFQLREIERLSYREIAEATGQSMDAVKVNLHRARQRVREAAPQISGPNA